MCASIGSVAAQGLKKTLELQLALSKFASAMDKYYLHVLSWQSLALKENLLVLDNWMALFSSPVVALCISYLLAMEGIKTINELSVF